MPGFNTVEGWNFVYKVSFGTILQDTNKTRLTITPAFRYAFSRDIASGNLKFQLRNQKYRLELEGGRYIKQFNADEPILPIVNTFTTLFLEKNLMKLYERRYIDLNYRRKLSQYVTVNGGLSINRRYPLFNTTNDKLIDRKSIEGYTSNIPNNEELLYTGFGIHNALIGSLQVTARPWLKYQIRNGKKYEIGSSSPTFMAEYYRGIPDVLGSDVDYDRVELGIKHEFNIGVRGHVDVALRGGAFLQSNKLEFMDYKHFLGNQTPFATADPVGSFRLLDYYTFSTRKQYFAGNIHYHFRRFLVTSIPLVRMAGVSENIFVNYLATPTSKNYTELGYSIDGILRFFRLEAVASFRDGKYMDYGFRIGINTAFSTNFSDN
jgi:hypothetical protein